MRSFLLVAVAVIAVGSSVRVASADPGGAACDLAGGYRLRFRSNGQDGYWLRFTVDGTGGSPLTARLTAPAQMLDLAPGALASDIDPVACTLTLSTRNAHAGDLKIALHVDASTDAVTGQLTRTKTIAADDSPVAITGIHDRAAHVIAPADACLAPGVYALKIDRKHKWKNAAADDKRACRPADLAFDIGTIQLRVEWLGTQLVIDTVDAAPPYAEKPFVTETATRGRACHVHFVSNDSATNLDAQLVFGKKDAITGTAHLTHQVVVETDESEDLWTCETTGITLTAKRIATP